MTYNLTLAWLYPELMSTYGDRGNIIVLQQIAKANGIGLNVERVNQTTNHQSLITSDLLFMGGAQDLQQEIVNKDLLSKKGQTIAELIEKGIPGLFICGAFQFLGKHYKDAYGTKIKGIGIFDMYTETPTGLPRLTGNIIVSPSTTYNPPSRASGQRLQPTSYLVGFENHGGRTYLADQSQAFATVVSGFGNNGGDKTEGIQYKNAIGTYMHGPILPSNPELAISMLELALLKKCGKKIELSFDNTLASFAKKNVLKRLKI